MSKHEFMRELAGLLRSIPEHERIDILADYEEHFNTALSNGIPESEIVNALGNPKIIVKEIIAESRIERAEQHSTIPNILNATIAIVSLGFLNLVFVLGPFIGISAIIFAMFVVAFTLTVAPLGLFIFGGFTDLLRNSFLIITLISIGILLGIGMLYVSRWFFKLFVHYLQFNLSVIRRKNQ
jgi:uncharacterized membrane protein